MRASGLLCVALAEDQAVGRADDATDARVGIRQADGRFGQHECGPEPLVIERVQLAGWWCQVLPLISGVAASSAGQSKGVAPSPARMTRKFWLISDSVRSR